MYRQHIQEKQVDGEWFVNRVYELPVVTSAVEQLTSFYSGVKLHNRLFRFTLETAEGGLHVAVETARPVVAKFDKQLGLLNTVACHQLDKLEQVYPIITKPTEEVLKETKQHLTTAVEPITSRVSAVKEFGVNKVTYVTTSAGEKINGVREFGRSKLHAATDLGTKQMTRAMETAVCRESIARIGLVLDLADHYVDTYLPADENEDLKSGHRMTRDDDDRQIHEVVVNKAANLGGKVRRRMYGRIAGQLRHMRMRTSETIERLHFTVDLMEYSRGAMNGTVNKASYIWTEINKSDEDVANELIADDSETRLQSNSTFERRAIATARHLTQKVKQTAATFGVAGVPEIMYTRLQPLCAVVASSLSAPTSTAAGLGRHAYGVLSQYPTLLTDKFSLWIQWIAVISPVKVPGLDQWTSRPRAADSEPDLSSPQRGVLHQSTADASTTSSGSEVDMRHTDDEEED